MKFKDISERGQALVIIAFAMVVLIAITGLAIDGSNTFADRRAAQNAADTAALAGAVMRNNLEKGSPGIPPASPSDCIEPPSGTSSPCWDAVVLAALDRADSNGYGRDLTNHDVEVHSPPVDGPYATCNNMPCDPHNYIQVIITTNVNTFFAKVIGIGQTHNRVEAVALSDYRAAGPLYGGNSLVSLAPGNTGSNCGTNAGFIVAGSGTVNVSGGGIFVNSDNSGCAFNQNGCNTTLNITGGGISVVGGSNLQSSCSGQISPAPNGSAQQVDFPPPYPFAAQPPAECGVIPHAPTPDLSQIKTVDVYPGYYDSFPPPTQQYNNIIMEPGVYCVSNVVKVSSPNTVLSGNGVFIYIMPDGSFDFQGGTLNLSAPTTGDYKGYLIYVDFTYPSNPIPSCIINGNTADSLTGAIIAPYCDITINGTSSSNPGVHSQIIGYTITLSGSNNFNFIYDSSEQPTDPGTNTAGIYR